MQDSSEYSSSPLVTEDCMISKSTGLSISDTSTITLNKRYIQEDYRIGKSLGSGTYSSVRQAICKKSDAVYAAKIFEIDD